MPTIVTGSQTQWGQLAQASLEVGDKIETSTGAIVDMVGLTGYSAVLTAYNLQISNTHIYYAGTTPVLVHNSCDPSLDAINIARHANEEEHVIPGVNPNELDLYVHDVMQSRGAPKVGGGEIWWDSSKGCSRHPESRWLRDNLRPGNWRGVLPEVEGGLMRDAGRTSSGEAIVEATRDELLMLFGGLVEAVEALSPAEFRARIGLSVSATKPLIATLRNIIGDLGDS